jgi:hypothetical protein
LRARENSSLEVSVASRPGTSNFNGKPARDTSRFGLGSQTKCSSVLPKSKKASRILGTKFFATTESFDSPVGLRNVHLDDITRDT